MANRDLLKGTLFGLTVGALSGILMAPRSGRATRRQIKEKAADAKETVIDKYDDFKERITNKADDVKENAQAKGRQLRRRAAKALDNEEV